MRREGFEFSVSTPRVLFKEIDGVKCEPMEELVIDVPEESLGSVMEKMGSRKAEMTHMEPVGSRMRVKFLIPSRGLFGYRSEFLTDTKGEGILNTIFAGYQPYKGEIPTRANGSLISFETGEAVTYGLYNAQERGTLFISPGTPVYEGMVVDVYKRQIMSVFIYAGALEYMAVSFLVSSTPMVEIAIMSFLVNFRHIVYGLSLIHI